MTEPVTIKIALPLDLRDRFKSECAARKVSMSDEAALIIHRSLNRDSSQPHADAVSQAIDQAFSDGDGNVVEDVETPAWLDNFLMRWTNCRAR